MAQFSTQYDQTNPMLSGMCFTCTDRSVTIETAAAATFRSDTENPIKHLSICRIVRAKSVPVVRRLDHTLPGTDVLDHYLAVLAFVQRSIASLSDLVDIDVAVPWRLLRSFTGSWSDVRR